MRGQKGRVGAFHPRCRGGSLYLESRHRHRCCGSCGRQSASHVAPRVALWTVVWTAGPVVAAPVETAASSTGCRARGVGFSPCSGRSSTVVHRSCGQARRRVVRPASSATVAVGDDRSTDFSTGCGGLRRPRARRRGIRAHGGRRGVVDSMWSCGVRLCQACAQAPDAGGSSRLCPTGNRGEDGSVRADTPRRKQGSTDISVEPWSVVSELRGGGSWCQCDCWRIRFVSSVTWL